jgi:hypothetical protein
MASRDATSGSKLTILVRERADDLIAWIRDGEGALRHCLGSANGFYTAGGIGELIEGGIELSEVEKSASRFKYACEAGGSPYAASQVTRGLPARYHCWEWRAESMCCKC